MTLNAGMIAAIAAGGAVGAVGRHLVNGLAASLFGLGFPAGTLIVNVSGSFVMGVLVELGALAWSPSPELRALLVTGLLGAFTTFSTFSLDLVTLFERKAHLAAGLYFVGSIVLSIGGLVLGMRLMRMVLT